MHILPAASTWRPSLNILLSSKRQQQTKQTVSLWRWPPSGREHPSILPPTPTPPSPIPPSTRSSCCLGNAPCLLLWPFPTLYCIVRFWWYLNGGTVLKEELKTAAHMMVRQRLREGKLGMEWQRRLGGGRGKGGGAAGLRGDGKKNKSMRVESLQKAKRRQEVCVRACRSQLRDLYSLLLIPITHSL